MMSSPSSFGIFNARLQPLRGFRGLILLMLFALSLVLHGCAHSPEAGSSVRPSSQNPLLRLAKSDIDEVIEIHQQALLRDLQELALKLYARNPTQRAEPESMSLEAHVSAIFQAPFDAVYADWPADLEFDALIRLAFDAEFSGDRVLAFVVGLQQMFMAAYENRTEFYYLVRVDQQKLYHSARNVEIAAWLLAERRDANGQLILLSDSLEHEQRNLSFQRLLGRMIATQDNLAEVIAQKTGRVIKTVVIQAATMVFLPI